MTLALLKQGQTLHNQEINMETVNLVNTIAKVATSKASNVAVSKDSVIAQNVSLQPEMGESLPENEA